MSTNPVKIGIAGLGNVGEEVARQILNGFRIKDEIYPLELIGVSYKSQSKKRNLDLSGIKFYEDAVSIAKDKEIDLVIELIGGETGIAKELCETALRNHKGLITANKALVANSGHILADLAEKNNLFFAFEASVAGGIPILKIVRESLSANKINRMAGILNGTANYILSEMENTKGDFNIILKDAQDKGFAEQDPSFDIDGIDAAHKISILSAMAFGKLPSLNSMEIKGIRNIRSNDMDYCEELGFKIRLLGVASETKNKDLNCSVQPWLVPNNNTLASVIGPMNAIEINSNLTGPVLITGAGAGSGPTASAVLSDVIDFAAGRKSLSFSRSAANIIVSKKATSFEKPTRYYIRLSVVDQSGVLAELTAIFRDNNISIESFIQKGISADKSAQLVILTHSTDHEKIKNASLSINELKIVLAEPICLPIYE
ncbi:MAG: homoserine dehydrogenase [Chloroflexota bacterium]|jgi:homoserine dehydrogenase|nr:homoserine dehydrogenase [Chloroflexota bacterium]|tara:strand:- start:2341 stop:3630 length:1290 start_codon:yes stop_codon:yes gene_type:complete